MDLEEEKHGCALSPHPCRSEFPPHKTPKLAQERPVVLGIIRTHIRFRLVSNAGHKYASAPGNSGEIKIQPAEHEKRALFQQRRPSLRHWAASRQRVTATACLSARVCTSLGRIWHWPLAQPSLRRDPPTTSPSAPRRTLEVAGRESNHPISCSCSVSPVAPSAAFSFFVRLSSFLSLLNSPSATTSSSALSRIPAPVFFFFFFFLIPTCSLPGGNCLSRRRQTAEARRQAASH
ncbi:hypothetical protein VTI74DRAFT_1979 [Chaetomium olivicolor]